PALPEPDSSQDAVHRWVLANTGHALVVGGPGSGKTTLAVQLAAEGVRSGIVAADRLVVLAATRRGAGDLRDRVSSALGVPTSQPLARTAASLAWSILRVSAVTRGEPIPTLIPGAEQDEILRELLEGHLMGRVAGPDWSSV